MSEDEHEKTVTREFTGHGNHQRIHHAAQISYPARILLRHAECADQRSRHFAIEAVFAAFAEDQQMDPGIDAMIRHVPDVLHLFLSVCRIVNQSQMLDIAHIHAPYTLHGEDRTDPLRTEQYHRLILEAAARFSDIHSLQRFTL